MLTSKEIAARTFTPEMAANEMAGRFLDAAHAVTYRAEHTRERLMENIDCLKRQLDRSLIALRKGETVNSLGICQSQAGEIDRLCGELAALSEVAGHIQYDAQKAGLLPE